MSEDLVQALITETARRERAEGRLAEAVRLLTAMAAADKQLDRDTCDQWVWAAYPSLAKCREVRRDVESFLSATAGSGEG